MVVRGEAVAIATTSPRVLPSGIPVWPLEQSQRLRLLLFRLSLGV